MKNPQINQRIRVVDEKTGRLSERVYRIVQVNSADRSLVAIDDFGPEGVSIHWELCVEATPQISRDWIRSQVPQDVWALLSAFDGWNEICLKPEVGVDVLLQTLDLQEWILRAQRAQKNQTARKMPILTLEDVPQSAEFDRYFEQLKTELQHVTKK
jgi:hypothetical protein